MSFERPILETSRIPEDRSSAPFPVDRLTWSDADFEREHRRMSQLDKFPCVRGERVGHDTTLALDALTRRLKEEGQTENVWSRELRQFSPDKVAMRYGYGADWS